MPYEEAPKGDVEVVDDPDQERGPPLGAGSSASPWGYRVMIALVVCFTNAFGASSQGATWE